MELDLQNLFGPHVYRCTHWLRPRNSTPPPPHLGSYARALLVSQDRRHLCVTPWRVFFLILVPCMFAGLALQDAVVEVTEEGTRASAATVVGFQRIFVTNGFRKIQAKGGTFIITMTISRNLKRKDVKLFN
jgi:hypothetical protein